MQTLISLGPHQNTNTPANPDWSHQVHAETSGSIQKHEAAESAKRRPAGDVAGKCWEFVGWNRSVVGYCSNDFAAAGVGGFADAPVDVTITSKAKIKNSNAAIHHIISYQRTVCCAVALFANRVFDLLYDTMMMGVRCGGTLSSKSESPFTAFHPSVNGADPFARMRGVGRRKDLCRKGHKEAKNAPSTWPVRRQ
jgi:hypothetical protein